MKYMDKAQTDLDAAAKRYRRAWDRGYLAQQRGDHDAGQRILDRANAEYDAAKAAFATAREKHPVPRFIEEARRIEASHR